MSPQVMNVDHSTRLLFIGLITQADDHGRGTADPRRLKAAIYGGDDITSSNVRRWLDDLVAQNLVVIYETASHGLLYELPSWKAHQKIDRAKPSGYPPPSESLKIVKSLASIVDDSSSDRRSVVGDRIGSDGSLGSDRITQEGPEIRRAIVERSTNGVNGHADAFEEWQSVRVLYPEGIYRQADFLPAEKFATQCVDQGLCTWVQWREAVQRYAAQRKAASLTGSSTAHTLSPKNFFQADARNWLELFPLPTAPERRHPEDTGWRPT